MIIGINSEIQSRNLILQNIEEDNFNEKHRDNSREDLSSCLDDLLKQENTGQSLSSKEITNKIKNLSEEKGKGFRHTKEYYAAIKEEQERMKAYRGLEISSAVISGEEAEIKKNPFKFLNIPENSSFEQTRVAWIRLSKSWFPDLMFPENKEQYKQIFGYSKDNSLDGIDILDGKKYSSWIEEIMSTGPPQTLSAQDLEKLSPNEQKQYFEKKEAYRNKELKYEKVKAEMRTRATKKMQIINKAYIEAKKRFSDLEEKTFAGFSWEKEVETSEFLKELNPNFGGFKHEKIKLEGDGEIRKDYGELIGVQKNPYLTFDFGETYLGNPTYRQFLDLKSFFAWTELIQKKELSPTLLEDLTKKYKLKDNQAEQLRLMIMNKEEEDFIIDTLDISENKNNHKDLSCFIEMAYNGPEFLHNIGVTREDESFKLGVEFTKEDSLILRYRAQIDNRHWLSTDTFAQFTPTDVQIMRSVAYGPLLQKMNESYNLTSQNS